MQQAKRNKMETRALLLASQLAFAGVFAVPICKAAGGKVTSSQAAEKVGDMISTIIPIFRLAGIVLLVYGVAQLILAIKDEATEPKVKAITITIIGVCLVTLRSLMSGLLSALGVSDVF